MQIHFEKNRISAASNSLLELSRSMRTSRNELEDVCSRLRKQTELKKCLIDLNEQKEALEVLTARLVNISSALREITDLYDRTEARNEALLDGQDQNAGRITKIRTGSLGGLITERINKILYR